ncbi:uncharacterized protein LOC134698047 [Mytilus trossulus]|uniref:uncharacterized protein LOC134698047 n=1 Tax=Mytilus trossulus TaxID=6551 RepID=UPI00300405B2
MSEPAEPRSLKRKIPRTTKPRPFKRKILTTKPRPLKRKIPPYLQKQVEDIQKKLPRNTGPPELICVGPPVVELLYIGPPDDLDDSKKRWLVVGICLHTIISPVLRTYVEHVVTKLCYSLTRLHKINQQTFRSYLRRYSSSNTKLNYEAINNNKSVHGLNKVRYDYRVKSPVDLSRLFLQTNMAHFTAFDGSCDSSALLGIIVNIDRFLPVVQFDAKRIRSEIRNPWAHCDFTKWTTTKYGDSFQLMKQLITNLRLGNTEEKKILGELNRWETNVFNLARDYLIGQNFLSGTKLDVEIVDEIRQQTHILSEYAQRVCEETDRQFVTVQKELTDLESKYKKHDVKLKNLETELQKQDEDIIPKHIQEQIEIRVEDWEKKDKMFVTTRASDYVMECLQDNSCVTLTGPSGVGKSFISRHTALVLQKEGYKIIPVFAPTDIRDYYKPGKQTVFIVDDICGNFTANQQQIDNWRQMLPVIDTIVADKCCKIIVSCRLQVYKDEKFKILLPFKSCECNLISDKICLTSEEKNIIAKTYIGTHVDNIDELSQKNEFFPLLCSLYPGVENGDVKEFFNNPFHFYKNELDNLSMRDDEGKYKICSLALLVLFNNEMKETWFQGKVSVEQRNIIEDTCNACDINRSTSKAKLKKELETLDGTFIYIKNGIYRALHDKLFDFLVHYFGQQKMIECLIDHGDSDLVHERFISQKSPDDKNSNIDFIIEIPKYFFQSYLKRFIKDWSAGKVTVVFNNNNMKVSSFREQLLHHLKQLDQSHQVTLANTQDTVTPKEHYGTTPLTETCHKGYTDMVQWLLHKNADVNLCDTDGYSPLYWASYEGSTDVVKLLLEKNPNVDICDKECYSTLSWASLEGHTDVVKLLLEKNPNVDFCNMHGESPLYLATYKGHTDVVKLLLEKNPNVDLCEKDGRSPLYWASLRGNTDIVKLLLEKNPNIDLCNKDGNSPLSCASLGGNTDIVKLLLEKNPEVDLCDKDRRSPLFWASYNGHTDVVKLLLEKNPNVDLCDKDGFSPLSWASIMGNTDIVMLLLGKNPNVDFCNKDGKSPLYWATYKGHTDVVKLLLEKNPDVNLCDKNCCSPLYWASLRGNTDIVKLLLEKNPNVDLCNKDGDSHLSGASLGGNTDIVKLLLEKNPEVDLCDKDRRSPLFWASYNGHTDVVKLLLEKNPNVDLCDKDGFSPLSWASLMGNTDIVMLLLGKNPNVDFCNKDGKSPLYWATYKGHTDVVKLLLEKNPNVDLCEKDGCSPLYVASSEGHTDVVKLLLEKNPNVDLCDNNGCSPLYVASGEDNTDIVKLLLEKNPNVDLCDKDGQSPLSWASYNGHTDVVKLLLEKNPDVNLCDKNCCSPLYWASYKGHTDVVKLLLEKNPNVDLCNNDGVSPLHWPSNKGHTGAVKLLLEKNHNVDQ